MGKFEKKIGNLEANKNNNLYFVFIFQLKVTTSLWST
jgi:hypothetical protein